MPLTPQQELIYKHLDESGYSKENNVISIPTSWLKAICDAMDEYKEHFIKCGRCGVAFDMRDLNQVIDHETCLPVKELSRGVIGMG